MKRVILLLTVLLTTSLVQSQSFETNYNYFNFSAFAVDDDNFYIGLDNGFVVQNRETGEAEYYNALNSSLMTSSIEEIEIYKGGVYLSGLSGLYKYADKSLNRVEMGKEDIRKLQIIDDNIWTFDAKSIYKYDGAEVKEWKIDELVEFDFELYDLVVYKNYAWISYKAASYNNKYYYSGGKTTKDYRFILLNLDDSSVLTFTDEERPYEEWNAVSFQIITNDEIWVSVSSKKSYIYSLKDNTWRENEHISLIPVGYELLYGNAITDNNGDVWFTIQNIDASKSSRLIAVYSYESNSVEIKFPEMENDPDFNPYYYYMFDGNIVSVGTNGFYFIDVDSINTIKASNFSDEYLNRSKIYKNGENYFMMLTEWFTPNVYDRIVNITEKKIIEYTLNNESTIPTPEINSYVQDNKVKLLRGGRNFIYNGENWIKESDFGMQSSTLQLQYDRFSNGDLVANYGKLFSIVDNQPELYDNINNEKAVYKNIHDFKIFDNKMYIYGSYLNEGEDMNAFVSVLNRDNNELFLFDENNSCIPDFRKQGTMIIRYTDSVPTAIEVDIRGNIWVLTQQSLFIIDENLNCTYRDGLMESPGDIVDFNQLGYSSVDDKMYGYAKNTLFNLNSETLDSVSTNTLGRNNIVFFGGCSDGNVYVTTDKGELFRLNSITDWTQIEVIPGKKELDFNFKHVSYFQDTLYLSTDLGLFKIGATITSVENEDSSNNNLSVFPNPTTDYITLKNIAPNSTIQILSLSGSVVKEVSTDNRIDVRDLSAGVYMIKVGEKVQKFVKY